MKNMRLCFGLIALLMTALAFTGCDSDEWEPEGWERLDDPYDNLPNTGLSSLGFDVEDGIAYVVTEGRPIKKWDGENWVEIEDKTTYGYIFTLQVEGDDIFVVHGSGGLMVTRINTRAGESFQTPELPPCPPANWCASVFVEAGNIYVAYTLPKSITGLGCLRVKRFDYGTSNWVDVGAQPVSEGEVQLPSIFVDNGVPYVAYQDFTKGTHLSVKRFAGENWIDVGDPSITKSGVQRNDIYVYDGIPYVAYSDSAHSGRTTVIKFEGTQWSTVGNPGFSNPLTGGVIQRTIDLQVLNGLPYVGNSWSAEVKQFDGEKWEDIGSNTNDRGTIGFSLRLTEDGTPYVAFLDECPRIRSCSQLNVMKYVGD